MEAKLDDSVIKRVLAQCRAQEARFREEHGMSSAQFFFESGYSDDQSETMQGREEEAR
jgi:hypothetical protein